LQYLKAQKNSELTSFRLATLLLCLAGQNLQLEFAMSQVNFVVVAPVFV